MNQTEDMRQYFEPDGSPRSQECNGTGWYVAPAATTPKEKQSCVQNLCDEIDKLRAELAQARAEALAVLEQSALQLAACDCAAILDTPATHKGNKEIIRGNPAWSSTFESVMRRTAECIHLRDELKDLRRTIECEGMDPCGTIWDHADKVQKESAALRAELAAANRYISELEDRMDSVGLAYAQAAARNESKP